MLLVPAGVALANRKYGKTDSAKLNQVAPARCRRLSDREVFPEIPRWSLLLWSYAARDLVNVSTMTQTLAVLLSKAGSSFVTCSLQYSGYRFLLHGLDDAFLSNNTRNQIGWRHVESRIFGTDSCGGNR